jgi:multidrug efflux pump subunit AcrA (membrane-fusion protein)
MNRLIVGFATEGRLRRVAAIALLMHLTAATTWVWAHAGHAALPTKGVDTSELAQGKLIVSRASRDVLGVQTAEVEPRAAEEKILAYATLIALWQEHAYATTRILGRIVELHFEPGQTVSVGLC